MFMAWFGRHRSQTRARSAGNNRGGNVSRAAIPEKREQSNMCRLADKTLMSDLYVSVKLSFRSGRLRSPRNIPNSGPVFPQEMGMGNGGMADIAARARE